MTSVSFWISTDLQLSTGILALIASHAVYVAVELRTTLLISIAFATTFSVLLVGGLWLSAQIGTSGSDKSPADATAAPQSEPIAAAPAPDGGSIETTSECADARETTEFEEFETAETVTIASTDEPEPMTGKTGSPTEEREGDE